MNRFYIAVNDKAFSMFSENGSLILADELERLLPALASHKVIHIYCSANPTLEKILNGCNILMSSISERRWKDYHRLLNKEKDMAREKVIHLFPKHINKFRRKKDIDRAEAVLIGLTGLGQMRVVND